MDGMGLLLTTKIPRYLFTHSAIALTNYVAFLGSTAWNKRRHDEFREDFFRPSWIFSRWWQDPRIICSIYYCIFFKGEQIKIIKQQPWYILGKLVADFDEREHSSVVKCQKTPGKINTIFDSKSSWTPFEWNVGGGGPGLILLANKESWVKFWCSLDVIEQQNHSLPIWHSFVVLQKNLKHLKN